MTSTWFRWPLWSAPAIALAALSIPADAYEYPGYEYPDYGYPSEPEPAYPMPPDYPTPPPDDPEPPEMPEMCWQWPVEREEFSGESIDPNIEWGTLGGMRVEVTTEAEFELEEHCQWSGHIVGEAKLTVDVLGAEATAAMNMPAQGYACYDAECNAPPEWTCNKARRYTSVQGWGQVPLALEGINFTLAKFKIALEGTAMAGIGWGEVASTENDSCPSAGACMFWKLHNGIMSLQHRRWHGTLKNRSVFGDFGIGGGITVNIKGKKGDVDKVGVPIRIFICGSAHAGFRDEVEADAENDGCRKTRNHLDTGLTLWNHEYIDLWMTPSIRIGNVHIPPWVYQHDKVETNYTPWLMWQEKPSCVAKYNGF
jgi:hypothetical protein